MAGPGEHYLRYSSVERHLAAEPPIRPGRGGNRYPRHYRNVERLFPSDQSLFELLNMEYPCHLQNARAFIPGFPGATKFTRTITNRDREIKGVIYNPYNYNEKSYDKYVRAEEVYPTPPRCVKRC